jgi:hypothetical protein
VMTKAEPPLFSGIRDKIIEAACLRVGIKASLGWRRKQWAVIGPDGGTRRVGDLVFMVLLR